MRARYSIIAAALALPLLVVSLAPAGEPRSTSDLKEAARRAEDEARGRRAPPPRGNAKAFKHRAHGLTIAMIEVPGGTFLMGSPPGDDSEWALDSSFTVTMSGFSMAAHGVTNAQYAAFLTAQGNVCSGYRCVDETTDSLMLKESGGRWTPVSGWEDFPVAEVSWYGANGFAQWVGGQFPTEAQWEYACREGAQQNTWSGTSDETAVHRFANTKGLADGHDGLAAAGALEPNGWGLHDLSGNLYEWTSDWKADYPKGPVTDPTGGPPGEPRIIRNGSFVDSTNASRCATRWDRRSEETGYFMGFRIVLVKR